MAGSSRYTAILDANVLYPTLVRDVLLSFAHADLYHARWTVTIEDEWARNLVVDRPDIKDRIPALVIKMAQAIPDCLVTNYESLIPTITLPDQNDRHVVAAAILGHADAIVTSNLKHFPADALAPYGIEAQHPDDFIMNQLRLNDFRGLAAIKAMRARWKNPPRSAQELIESLRMRGLVQTADLLKQAEDLI